MDFIFEKYAFDAKSGVLTLRYAFDGGASFVETITFPIPLPEYYSEKGADRIFKLIFLLAGVSYYKTKPSDRLVCKAFKIDKPLAQWISKVYQQGLGEFAYQNKLKLDHIKVVPSDAKPDEPLNLKLQDRILVPVGGGKDSIVTLETLRDLNPTLFALGGPGGAAQPIADTIKVSGMPHIYVSRVLSPNLAELNKAGAFNGHIPITAILSAIALACAVIYGYSAVVMSNESSASAPNFGDINHQYSKSFEFERELAVYIQNHVSPELKYFSFLRPLTEIAISQKFSKYTQYHHVFRSCNTAFKQDEAARGKKWCCNCPKCRFVFLALAPFLPKKEMVAIFGENMLDDSKQLSGYAQLCGVEDFKPFECVGTVDESAATIQKLATMREWQDDVIVEMMRRKISNADFDYMFRLDTAHILPFNYLDRLNEPKSRR